MRDLQATILHILGLDPFRLQWPHLGLDQRLIGQDDSAAKIRPEILV